MATHIGNSAPERIALGTGLFSQPGPRKLFDSLLSRKPAASKKRAGGPAVGAKSISSIRKRRRVSSGRAASGVEGDLTGGIAQALSFGARR